MKEKAASAANKKEKKEIYYSREARRSDRVGGANRRVSPRRAQVGANLDQVFD